MEALLREGRTRAIGVSNFQPDRVMDLIVHNEVAPAVDQVEVHPFQQQVETQAFLQENGVQIQAWAPFAEGRGDMFTSEVLGGIAGKHGKSVAQVILRWQVQRGVATIPKSVRRERMEENYDIFDFELGADDMEQIATLDTKASLFFDHRDPAVVKMLGEAQRET